MSSKDKFIPELHDIGKLIDHKDCKYMTFQYKHETSHSHYFRIDELKKDGISIPQNKTFEGIQKHHCGKYNPYCKNEKAILNDLDIVLLIVADHFASSFSRLDETTKNEVKRLTSAQDKSVYKLWNRNSQRNIKEKLINCTKMNIEKILSIVSNNDWETLSSKYKELLELIPEDKMPLFNVVSLKTHMTLVGKVYKFLKSQVESFGNGEIKLYKYNLQPFTGIKGLENKLKFKLVFASISMPKFIARVDDLSFFEILNKQLNRLKQENQVLFISPGAFLFICNKEEKVEDIKFIKEIINLGFKLKTKEIIKPLSELVELPQELVNNEINKQSGNLIKVLRNEKIPDDRKEERKREFTENYGKFYNVYEPQRPEEIKNLCDICQQNKAIPYNELTDEEKKLVTKEERGKKIIESLCKYCLNVRKEYEKSGNLKPLAKWEDDALWIKVSLDIDNLIEALKRNYEEYIDNALKNNPNLAQKVKRQYKLRYTWISEFLYEYDRFLDEFYKRVNNSYEIIKINRDFFVVKKLENGQIKKIISIYLDLFNKYFYDLKVFKNNPPIRLSIIWTSVKSPLIEVWREITKAENPISIVLRNGNKLKTDVKTISYLNNELNLSSAGNVSSFLYRLADLYEHSGLSIFPLIELFNKRWKYGKLYNAISEKKLSIVDVLNWYKIAKE